MYASAVKTKEVFVVVVHNKCFEISPLGGCCSNAKNFPQCISMFVTVVVTICKRLHAKIPHFAFNAAARLFVACISAEC